MISYTSTSYPLPQVLYPVTEQFQCWQQFWFCVSSNVKRNVWSPLVPITPAGGAMLCFCSSRRLMEIHGTASIHWAELGHHRAFSRSALQSRPYRACPGVYVVLLLLVFFWFLNHYVGKSVWTLENCSSAGAKKEQPYTAETVRAYVYPGGLGTLKGLWMT